MNSGELYTKLIFPQCFIRLDNSFKSNCTVRHRYTKHIFGFGPQSKSHYVTFSNSYIFGNLLKRAIQMTFVNNLATIRFL